MKGTYFSMELDLVNMKGGGPYLKNGAGWWSIEC